MSFGLRENSVLMAGQGTTPQRLRLQTGLGKVTHPLEVQKAPGKTRKPENHFIQILLMKQKARTGTIMIRITGTFGFGRMGQ